MKSSDEIFITLNFTSLSFLKTNVSTAFQQPSSVTCTKTNESDLYTYNSTRTREVGKQKDQGRWEFEEKIKQEKQTTHFMSSVSHFWGSVFAPSFVAMLYGVIWQSHMQFLTFLSHDLKFFSASLYWLLQVLDWSNAYYWHPEPSLSPSPLGGLHSIQTPV